MFKRWRQAPELTQWEDLALRLANGLDTVDAELLDIYGSLLAEGDYDVFLLRISPSLTPNDRYLTNTTLLDEEDVANEYVIPIGPVQLDESQVLFYEQKIREGTVPTAVSLGVLDSRSHRVEGTDDCDYVGEDNLVHFLLDGHHKLRAAANLGAELDVVAIVPSRDEIRAITQALHESHPASR
ncbi:hypothetical protein [Smaragdicoccus niigatensis]|uniref:hypothetical protein n=1 Tax=Smaragdicoccus niigatensis TaxID=359359 RepID=UPI0012E33554|nr:hypothetical protein [Smaragdicoccus niigatensis]